MCMIFCVQRRTGIGRKFTQVILLSKRIPSPPKQTFLKYKIKLSWFISNSLSSLFVEGVASIDVLLVEATQKIPASQIISFSLYRVPV